jgi:hypothetical protein
MQAIEQYRFAAEVNLAAGTKAFRRGLRNHELFRELAELAKEPQVQREIAERIATLSRAEIDTRYENGFDAALSAYLTVLGDTAEPEVITQAASAAVSAVNCWWTVGISRELLMRAVATGHVRFAPMGRLAAGVLTSGWKETPAERFQEWFDERKGHSSVETWSRDLRILTDAQPTGHLDAPVVPPPEKDQPSVPSNLRRRNKNRPRPAHRGAQTNHRSRMGRAS